MSVVIRVASAATILLGLAACDLEQYKRPISLTPHGEAFRHNMMVQIINPNPPAARPQITDAQRPVAAQEAYRSGEVPEIQTDKASPSTAQVQ